jgi:hypothetical protein
MDGSYSTERRKRGRKKKWRKKKWWGGWIFSGGCSPPCRWWLVAMGATTAVPQRDRGRK